MIIALLRYIKYVDQPVKYVMTIIPESKSNCPMQADPAKLSRMVSQDMACMTET